MDAINSVVPVNGHDFDDQYHAYLASLNTRFQNLVATKRPIFTTDASGPTSLTGPTLWEIFQQGFHPSLRKHYDCRACRHFIEKFGGLVYVDESGISYPLMWDHENIPEFMRASIVNMRHHVMSAKVTGVFICSDKTWGQPETIATPQSPYAGQKWQHLAVLPPKELIHYGVLKNAYQVAAAKLQDHETVLNALNEFKPEHVDQAIVILEADALSRGEKYLGVAKWMKSLYEIQREVKNHTKRHNLMWVKIAEAPDGFCHIRAGMIGELLEDIKKALPFHIIKANFDKKMAPDVHRRPQAAPTAGNIVQAEKIVAQLGIENSLKRRYLREDEVQAIWKPRAKQESGVGDSGVFGHLKPKAATPESPTMSLPAKNITWERFAEEVLPKADEISIRLGACSQYPELAPLVTAVDPESPPIFAWDTPECRNPVNWYHPRPGYTPLELGLVSNSSLYKISAVCYQPCMWNNFPHTNWGKAVMFILEGAKMSINRQGGLALFPEVLKSELFSIKSTIEAYSKNGKIEGIGEPIACGFKVGTDKSVWENIELTVKQGNVSTKWKLDRWN